MEKDKGIILLNLSYGFSVPFTLHFFNFSGGIGEVISSRVAALVSETDSTFGKSNFCLSYADILPSFLRLV